MGLSVLDELPVAERDGLPEADHRLAPTSMDEAARLLDHASELGAQVLVWGGGTHQGMGYRVGPDIVLSCENLTSIVAYEPDDLTVVVEAGVGISVLEALLAEHDQTALLSEVPGIATVGGAIAAGVSGWRRSRFGPTRDRVLQATLVTGDGRVVTGGGRVVKNVTGYDLPRLATGSFGSLGLVAQVCLKLWPLPSTFRTVMVESPEAALDIAFRPMAILETGDGAWCYLGGTSQEVGEQSTALGEHFVDELEWPEPVSADVVVSIRVPPSELRSVLDGLGAGRPYVAQFGVGETTVGLDIGDIDLLPDLRTEVEDLGGALVVTEAPAELYEEFDPWGTPPQTLEIQQRLIARFDPRRVINPGRLPGRI